MFSCRVWREQECMWWHLLSVACAFVFIRAAGLFNAACSLSVSAQRFRQQRMEPVQYKCREGSPKGGITSWAEWGKQQCFLVWLKMKTPRLLVTCLQTKQSKCVCICPCMYWICIEMLKWERGDQTGALGVAGGDKLQAICVIRCCNMENASEYQSELILSAELPTPGKQGGDGLGIGTGNVTG